MQLGRHVPNLDHYGHVESIGTCKPHVNLNRAHAPVLVMPAGRSAHIELGYIIGQGKPGYVLFDQEPERFDVMYNFATDVCFSVEELMAALGGPRFSNGFEQRAH